MKKKLKIILLFDTPYFTPKEYSFDKEFKDEENWYTERDVYQALIKNGHEVRLLGLFNDINALLEEIKDFKPDLVFNLTEVFNNKTYLDKNVASLLEILEIPYTGASSGVLFICNNKALSKKILRFHRLRVPRFYTFKRNHKVWLPKYLKLPLVIKPLCEEASRGIAQSSIVDNEDSLIERIKFIHESMSMDAIAEEYVDGRELYVTVIGNKRLTVLPARELKFGELPEDEPRIATYKAKWDDKYRDKWGIKSVYAGKLPNGMAKKIEEVCKRAYRALEFQSYARFDIRITPDKGIIYILEPNANPCLAYIDEVAQAAEKTGVSYEQLINKIVYLALQRTI
ncbi:MAG: ATP-grasp domain-containing protein [Candidatus Gygaella obscura]|nr:ATP-grasp domain-containing protein [Candidatus Gygaella obscura]